MSLTINKTKLYELLLSFLALPKVEDTYFGEMTGGTGYYLKWNIEENSYIEAVFRINADGIPMLKIDTIDKSDNPVNKLTIHLNDTSKLVSRRLVRKLPHKQQVEDI